MVRMLYLTLKEAVKERAFYSTLILYLFSLFIYFIVNDFTMFEASKVMFTYSLSVTEFLTLVLVFFLIFSFLTEDLNKKTIEYLLSLPLKRMDYILGRVFGIVFSGIFTSTLMLSGFVILNALLFKEFKTVLFLQLPLLWVMMLLITSLAYFLINASKRPVLISFIILFIYVIGVNLDDAVQFIQSKRAESIPAISKFLVKSAYYIFPNFSFFDMKISLSYGLSIGSGHYILVLLYGLIYSFIVILLSILIFQKKEIK